MHFYDLREVTDLVDDERATPEPGVTYDLRTIDNRRQEAGTAEYVFREGDVLYARMTTGESFAVTGPNSHVLVPRGL
ncbi:MAG: hypothetical protein GY783_01365 [Gammaproteobacteria bacterium]|nr:hypothetical protein [Gammaproteobacteria bacterium]